MAFLYHLQNLFIWCQNDNTSLNILVQKLLNTQEIRDLTTEPVEWRFLLCLSMLNSCPTSHSALLRASRKIWGNTLQTLPKHYKLVRSFSAVQRRYFILCCWLCLTVVLSNFQLILWLGKSIIAEILCLIVISYTKLDLCSFWNHRLNEMS